MVLGSFAFIAAQTPTQSAEAQKTGAEVVKLKGENKFKVSGIITYNYVP